VPEKYQLVPSVVTPWPRAGSESAQKVRSTMNHGSTAMADDAKPVSMLEPSKAMVSALVRMRAVPRLCRPRPKD